jgi:hypothetical protein
MAEKYIKALNDNDFCVVQAKDPSKIQFLDPIPAQSSRTKIDSAAIALSRIILNGQFEKYTTNGYVGRELAAKIFVDLVVKGSPLDPLGSTEERCQSAYIQSKIEESARLGREDARAERLAKKEMAAKTSKKPVEGGVQPAPPCKVPDQGRG